MNFNFENHLCCQFTYIYIYINTYGHGGGDLLDDLTENNDRLLDVPPRDNLDHEC